MLVSITPRHGRCPLPTHPAAPTGLSTNWGWSPLPRALGWDGGAGLTGAAEALLADPQQHGAAEVAVGGFLEMLQPPGMLPVILHILQGRRAQGSHPRWGAQPATLSPFHPIKGPSRTMGSPCSPSPPCASSTPVAAAPCSPGTSGSWHSWHRAPAPRSPSAQPGYRDALLVAKGKGMTAHLGKGVTPLLGPGHHG